MPRLSMALFGYVAFIVLSLSSGAAQAGVDTSRRFDVAAQPLDQVLASFSVQSGLQMLDDSSLAAGRRSAAVSGVMEPCEALVLMLAGTGLSARFTSAGAVVIYAGSTSAVMLNPITTIAAPVVGRTGANLETQVYTEVVQRQLTEALREDAALSEGDYSLSVRLWVDVRGATRKVEILTGSRDVGRDAQFLALASSLIFPEPPNDLPQPMRIEVLVWQQR